MASSLADRVEIEEEDEDDREDEESDTDNHVKTETTPISEREKMEKRLANLEAHFIFIRSQQKLQSELIEKGINAVREMSKSLKAETEMSWEEMEAEIASYELVHHGVNSDAVEDEVN